MPLNRRAFGRQALSLAALAVLGGRSSASEKEIARAIDTALAQWKVPGVAVAVVREGKVDYLRGHGVRGGGDRSAVSEDTLFPLGSCSKAFLTASLAMLADEGKLDWDDLVRRHLPWFRLSDPLADRGVSLRDLLCHRTGLATHDLLWYRPAWTPEVAVRRAGNLTLDRPFRSAFQYQSTMFTALGLALSQIAKRPWYEFIEKRLFAPLGMKTAGYSTASFASDDRAIGHRLNGMGEAESFGEWVPFKQPDAAASIHASARDLCGWLRFQLDEGKFDKEQLVSAKQLGQTHTPQMVIPQSDHDRALHPDTNLVSYGMAWVIQDYAGMKMVAHSGVLDGFRVQLTLIPAKRLGLAVLSNLHATRMNLALSYSLIDLLLQRQRRDWNNLMLKEVRKLQIMLAKKDEERYASQVLRTKPSRPLSDYSGTFEHPAYGTARLSVERGRLVLRYSTFEVTLEHFHYDTFLLRDPHLGELLFRFVLEGAKVQELKAEDWFGIVFRRKAA